MTHNPPPVPPNGQPFPPPQHWPVSIGPWCPGCGTADHMRWTGAANDPSDDGDINTWHCHGCGKDLWTDTTYWPVCDGPDCPYCLTKVTCWAAINPDELGDLWTCEAGHEFTLTSEGIVITPDNADRSDWAPIWPYTKRDSRDGDTPGEA